MSNPIEKREETLIKKYGSKEALAQKRAEWQAKSRKNPNSKKGGFAYLKAKDPDKLRSVSILAANKRWSQNNEKENNKSA